MNGYLESVDQILKIVMLPWGLSGLSLTRKVSGFSRNARGKSLKKDISGRIRFAWTCDLFQGHNVLFGSGRNVRGPSGPSVQTVTYLAVAHSFYDKGFLATYRNVAWFNAMDKAKLWRATGLLEWRSAQKIYRNVSQRMIFCQGQW